MKLDYDLIRDILIAIEKDEFEPDSLNSLNINGVDQTIIAKHLSLLEQAKLLEVFIEGNSDNSYESYSLSELPITWEGYQYLDAIRDKNNWESIKNVLKEKTLSFSYDTFKLSLPFIIKNSFGY
jgi:predicted transcriptional regulator